LESKHENAKGLLPIDYPFLGMNYQNCVMAWQEQREFLQIALDKLADHPLAEIVRYLMSQHEPIDPNIQGMYL